MSAPLQGAALDQRAYHVHMARLSAESRERHVRRAAHTMLDTVIDDRAGTLFQVSLRTAEAREWAGIVQACRREERRLAKLKHGGAA